MKALLMEEYKKLTFTDTPDPVITEPDEILVKIKAAAICGSDVHGFDGRTGRRRPPIIMGHEAAGEIVETGKNVKLFKNGDRITFDSTIYCGDCFFCRKGQVNLCNNRMVIGVSCEEYRRHGAFAEYLVIPERVCYQLPEALSWEEASVTEPAAVAAHSLRITPVELNDTVAVVGAGLIGLLLIDILRVSISGKIIAIDTDPSRLKTASLHGADAVFSPTDGDVIKNIQELTGGRGVDRAFEAVGVSESIKTAVLVTRKGGSVTLIGNVSPSIELPLQSVVSREINILGSCAISGEYPIVLDLMGRKKIDVKSIISKTAPLAEGQLWFDKLYNKEDNLLKVVLNP